MFNIKNDFDKYWIIAYTWQRVEETTRHFENEVIDNRSDVNPLKWFIKLKKNNKNENIETHLLWYKKITSNEYNIANGNI